MRKYKGGFTCVQKNFVSLILGTIGGILFALGLCMAMLPEWGAVILLALVLIRRKMEGKPVFVKLSAKTVGTVILDVVGALVLGAGMCMVMIWEMLIPGIIVGIVGIVLLLCLIRLVKGLH